MKKVLCTLSALFGLVLLISGTIDLNNLFDYEGQIVPQYITKDNTTNNPISNEGATLGRVLFYDKALSKDNTISCASCHIQEFAFGDTAVASIGVNGNTGRHSMRLINSGFSNETHFFWDERANTLEEQTTQPIQDHTEMGFSGTNGDPDFDSLLRKLSSIDYYTTLFLFQYGDTLITEIRIQNTLAQFIRSIQSFDSKFDAGLAITNNINPPFPNFTQSENNGKNLFNTPSQFDAQGNRIGGGAGCAGCHQGPEFDIDPIVANNGVVGAIGGGADFTNTKSPTLRDIFNPTGFLNTPLMHNGNFTNIQQVLNHYDSIPTQPGNTNLDPRLRPGGNLQKLHLTNSERSDLVAFLQTLTGSNVYVDERWSNPFDSSGNINIIDVTTSVSNFTNEINFTVYPNPCTDKITIEGPNEIYEIELYSLLGQRVGSFEYSGNSIDLNLENLSSGEYIIMGKRKKNGTYWTKKISKQ